MPPNPAKTRALAARIARWLVDKGRTEEAVSVLAAWAAVGANDTEGQELLAEALRIDPSSRLAKLSFERMEGVSGDHALLDEAIARWSPEALARLEREGSRAAGARAQVGFNNNVKHKDRTFHIQTEDSGLDKPHIITHLFADGGHVIKAHKRSYSKDIARDDLASFVRQLMKSQHLEMAVHLREGRFDDIILGRAVGGMDVLDYPPKVDLQRLATQKQSRIQADGAAARGPVPPAVAPRPRDAVNAHFRLRVTRRGNATPGPLLYEPAGSEAIIGSAGAISLPHEPFCHPREAAIRVREGRIWLHDFESGNGVFLRIRAPVELDFGDEFIVGDQLLRIERNPVSKDGPDPGPTYFYSSPRWISSFRVVQLFEGAALGACVQARGTTLQIGSAQGDFVFPSDPLVSDQHCLIEEQAGAIVLSDLGSGTGVFVRIKGEQELVNGDELLVGRTRMTLTTLRGGA
ncbi:MAG: FHA domain-containing protein [Myxococcota bacterium]|nr:FHA domain-containing protein [Myxococcota bacterium]